MKIYKSLFIFFSMEKRTVIISLAVVVLALVAILYFANKPAVPDNTDILTFDDSFGVEDTVVSEDAGDEIAISTDSEAKTIEVTSSGFSPSTLEVSKGATVIFVNKGSSPSWPASAIHPTHTVYPNSGLDKCGTSEEGEIFDACRGLEEGESWTFVFGEIGEWKYHDHLNPSNYGTVVVK